MQHLKDELAIVQNEKDSYGGEYPVNMDKQPEIVKNFLGIKPGETLTNVQIKEKLSRRIEEMKAEKKKIQGAISEDLKKANLIFGNVHAPHPLKTFMKLYTMVPIDIMPATDYLNQVKGTEPESFTTVMQTCVNNHLMSSAMAIGPGVAIKTLFSDVIVGGIKSAFS